MQIRLIHFLLVFVLKFASSHPICDFAYGTNIIKIIPNWKCNDHDVPNENYCDWFGISCTDGLISSIDLHYSGVEGKCNLFILPMVRVLIISITS